MCKRWNRIKRNSIEITKIKKMENEDGIMKQKWEIRVLGLIVDFGQLFDQKVNLSQN